MHLCLDCIYLAKKFCLRDRHKLQSPFYLISDTSHQKSTTIFFLKNYPKKTTIQTHLIQLPSRKNYYQVSYIATKSLKASTSFHSKNYLPASLCQTVELPACPFTARKGHVQSNASIFISSIKTSTQK